MPPRTGPHTLSTVIATLAAGLWLAGAALGQTAPPANAYPELSGVAAANFDTALDFIARMGDKETAEKIREHAKAGEISGGPLDGGEGGETNPVTGHITIDDDKLMPLPGRNEPPLDPENPTHMAQIAGLATTLIHEYTHSQQSFGGHFFSEVDKTWGSGYSLDEQEAWGAALDASWGWINDLRGQLEEKQQRNVPREDQLELAHWIRVLASNHRSLLDDYGAENLSAWRWLEDGNWLGPAATDKLLADLIGEMEAIIIPPTLSDEVADALKDLSGEDTPTPKDAAADAAMPPGMAPRPELEHQRMQETQGMSSHGSSGHSSAGSPVQAKPPGLMLSIPGGPGQ